MKKSTFLKFTMAFAFAVMVSSGFSQTEMTVSGGNDYVTVGKIMPYYAEPDAVQNPGFTVTDGNYVLTASTAKNFWNWTIPAGGTIKENVKLE